MKITAVEVDYQVRPHSPDPIRDALQTLTGGGSVSVRIRTDDGLVGESGSSFGRVDGAPRTLAVLIEEILAPLLIGRDPFFVGQLVEDLLAETEYHGSYGITSFGISAIDTALWDLVGKAQGVPTYLLWGPRRDRIPTYATVGWSNYGLDELRRRCAAAVEQGFGGVKIKVGDGTLGDDVDRIEATRAEVGPGYPIMVDANQVHTVAEAVRRGHAYQDLDVTWYEEPLPREDLAGYRELRDRLRIPIATGENTYTRTDFAAFLNGRACDVIQPDLRRAGGPTQLRAIGTLAASAGVGYASHGGGPVALSVLLCAPTAVWLEAGLKGSGEGFPRVENGFAPAPTGAGFAWE